jgi:hypothetical protein
LFRDRQFLLRGEVRGDEGTDRDGIGLDGAAWVPWLLPPWPPP